MILWVSPFFLTFFVRTELNLFSFQYISLKSIKLHLQKPIIAIILHYLFFTFFEQAFNLTKPELIIGDLTFLLCQYKFNLLSIIL